MLKAKAPFKAGDLTYLLKRNLDSSMTCSPGNPPKKHLLTLKRHTQFFPHAENTLPSGWFHHTGLRRRVGLPTRSSSSKHGANWRQHCWTASAPRRGPRAARSLRRGGRWKPKRPFLVCLATRPNKGMCTPHFLHFCHHWSSHGCRS